MSELAIGRDELECFVPHSGRMLLLNGIVGWGEDFGTLTALASVQEDNPFLNAADKRVSVIVGFEYMAQTIAALSGLERHLKGDSAPRPGYIIGVRDYRGHAACLPASGDFQITVSRLFQDGPVVSFECRITDGDDILAEGTINAYEPAREEGGIDQ